MRVGGAGALLLLFVGVTAGCGGRDQGDAVAATVAAEPGAYTCPMHPDVHQATPGLCPSCGMKLVAASPAAPEPAMGAAADGVLGTVQISTARQQLIGVKVAEVVEAPMDKVLVAAGTLASDENRLVETPSPVAGVVEQVLGNPIGQQVRRGEGLLVLRGEDGALTTVRATGTGHISWRVSAVGAKVPVGYNVCSIYDHAGIWVWVEIYESDIQWVSLGQAVSMTVPSWPGRRFDGKVTQVAPLLDPLKHTMRVRVDFANRDFSLKPGMSAVLQIHADAGARLSVPESAVMRTGLANVVFVAVGDGAFEVRDVSLGLLIDDRYEVTSGLTAGERIVVSGNFLVDSESRLQGVRTAWGGDRQVDPPGPR